MKINFLAFIVILACTWLSYNTVRRPVCLWAVVYIVPGVSLPDCSAFPVHTYTVAKAGVVMFSSPQQCRNTEKTNRFSFKQCRGTLLHTSFSVVPLLLLLLLCTLTPRSLGRSDLTLIASGVAQVKRPSIFTTRDATELIMTLAAGIASFSG